MQGYVWKERSLHWPVSSSRCLCSKSASHSEIQSLSAVTIVWNYVGELVFNLLVLVGAVKASDRIVKEMMGL